jgi:hypothetical protein
MLLKASNLVLFTPIGSVIRTRKATGKNEEMLTFWAPVVKNDHFAYRDVDGRII